MTPNYSGQDGGAADQEGSAAATAHLLLARLLPDADVRLLVEALAAEAHAPAVGAPTLSGVVQPEAMSPGERELRRVRRQLALGAAASELQHAFNNPLAALLAESQLLQLEPLAGEQRQAVERIVALARRLVTLTRQLAEGGAVPG